MSEVKTRAAVLSNGEYAVLVTERGGGCSALRGYALTRWQPDPLALDDGVVLYLRDLDSDRYWLLSEGDRGGLHVYADAIEQWCEHDGIHLKCTTRVASEAAAEIRTIHITNHSGRTRSLDLTTYVELALNTLPADAAHPAFSKLFVQTSCDRERNALIAWRRQRSPDDRTLWVAQRLTAATEFETNRTQFLGRTRTPATAVALASGAPLEHGTGTVLDPCFAQRSGFTLTAEQSIELELMLCAADSREELEHILDRGHAGPYASSRDAAPLALPDKWLAGVSLDLGVVNWEKRTPCHRPAVPQPRPDYGGFSGNGTEYVLEVAARLEPVPQPWINVVANEQFGFLISERGAGYTWAGNSRENRLTPWSNDAVCDPHGELLLLHDAGRTWSMLPGPLPAAAVYEVRHGFGYSRFRHESHGLEQDVRVFVPRSDPVKIVRVRITNTTDSTRELTLLSCAQLVLGSNPADTRADIMTAYRDGVIFATNTERGEFSERVAFAFPVSDGVVEQSATGSRRSFARRSATLDGTFGSDLDPAAALQLSFVLAPQATFDAAFLLGEATDESGAAACIERYRSLDAIDRALQEVTAYWHELLCSIQVSSPVPALDRMFNGWLAYQNLVCRMWGRSAFYQSGGAFGFRDQLQDSSALLYLDPQMTRDQILLHAAHQFVEGDVLHWWHPPSSKGIRTRFSDDLLWLPYIMLFYLQRTNDQSILDESIRFLTAPELEAGEDEIFVRPEPAGTGASLFEHCCLTIDRSLTRGAHDLPLIGVGDWNDGMNRVGREGRGESVWLGFFLFSILGDFIPLCEQRGDSERAQRYAAFLQDLQVALDVGGWDGEWYRRAYYDNGAPIGSSQSEECRIDALAQAWAVLSRAASTERAQQALDAMQAELVAEGDGIIRLLKPAFDATPNDPGYIKGYVPGVRENGGQYTHAALWAVRALAEFGMRERAAPLLEMLSPITRAQQPLVYQGEPYVIAADVYGEPPHVGRAGWTWYTGSAGWMYRVYLESILGFDLRADVVRLRPCVPSAWPGFSLQWRLPDGTTYTFEVTLTADATSTSHGQVLDGAIEIPIVRDRGRHVVRISAGPDVVPRYQPAPRRGSVPLRNKTGRSTWASVPEF